MKTDKRTYEVQHCSRSGDVMFSHTYSWTTGVTKKGNTHKWKVYYRVEKLIEKYVKNNTHNNGK